MHTVSQKLVLTRRAEKHDRWTDICEFYSYFYTNTVAVEHAHVEQGDI